jgi:UPF0755 protein
MKYRQKKLLAGLFGAALLASFASIGLYGWYLADFVESPGPSKTALEVSIEPGSSPRLVAHLLEKNGVISSEQAFYHYLRYLSGNIDQLKAGDYEFAAGQTPAQIIDILVKGRVKEIRFTIPEGSNKTDIAGIMERAGFGNKDELLALMNSAEMLTRLRAPEVSGGVEGYLFPDTYHFPKRTSPETILKRMRARLDEVLNPDMHQRLLEGPLDFNQVMTLAAIVEKETGDPLERPEIAGVFFNRLARKMKLQTDPTVIYAVPNYHGNLHKSDLAIDNPYNTYVYAGLPPGPIASPGLAAIKAVLWPATTNNLYFVSRNDGTHEFCPNLKCHEKAVRYWQIDYFKKKKST